MKSFLTEPEILHGLGKKIIQARLQLNATQGEISFKSGISKRTLERLEAGESIQLSSFIRVLRTLGYLEAFEQIFPEPTLSPMTQLKLQKKERQRASKKKTALVEERPSWTWGK